MYKGGFNLYENLTNEEARVCRFLEGLSDLESLTASQIMARLAIKDLRSFHQIIFDLRLKGLPIVSSKSNSNSGYWMARNKDELQLYLKKKERYIATHQKIITAMQAAVDNLA